jgi:hypothetical protein
LAAITLIVAHSLIFIARKELSAGPDTPGAAAQ